MKLCLISFATHIHLVSLLKKNQRFISSKFDCLQNLQSKAWTPFFQKTRQKRTTESENLRTSDFFRSHPAELQQNTDLKMLVELFSVSAGILRVRQPIGFV